jgi:ribonuclease P protein component
MRVGLVVPRFKQSAVARNRLKRRLRELARLQLLPSDIAVDVVVRIRPDAYEASFERLAGDVARVLSQLTRWRDTAGGLAPSLDGPPRAEPEAG